MMCRQGHIMCQPGRTSVAIWFGNEYILCCSIGDNLADASAGWGAGWLNLFYNLIGYSYVLHTIYFVLNITIICDVSKIKYDFYQIFIAIYTGLVHGMQYVY